MEGINKQLREEEKSIGREKRVMLAPSLSYPDGVVETTSQWIEGIESLMSVDVDLILLDFSTTYAPPDKAAQFLRDFSTEAFKRYKRP